MIKQISTLFFEEPTIVFDRIFVTSACPLVSVVIPVFNQEDHIERNLESLICCITLSWELIIVNDASEDHTLRILEEWGAKLDDNQPLLTRVRIFTTFNQLFETRCDHFAFGIAQGKYLLEVQADMNIREIGFDRKLYNALKLNSDLLMISGRGTQTLAPIINDLKLSSRNFLVHTFISLISLLKYPFINIYFETITKILSKNRSLKTQEHLTGNTTIKSKNLMKSIIVEGSFEDTKSAGLLGSFEGISFSDKILKENKIWISQTVMRGPLLIDRLKYEMVGGLQNQVFFLGFDDHDLAFRGWRFFSLRCAFVPVGFESPIEMGSTRRIRSLKTKWRKFLFEMIFIKRVKKTALYNITEDDFQSLPNPEIRRLNIENYEQGY